MDTRDLSHRLADLLRREHAALAEFLIALATFDRERRWLELGYTSLFYFLHRELGLSKGAAFYRKTAAELVQRYPEIIEPLRQGKLCLTSVVALAKVITPENRAEVLPRFFHASKQDAQAIVAELKPEAAPPRREVVTAVPTRAAATLSSPVPAPRIAAEASSSESVHPANLAAAAVAVQGVPAPPAPDLDRVEPLTADLRRFHVTVSKRFLDKLAAARDALSHSLPDASSEAVLEAALDLLLEKHDRKKGLVKKPRPAPARPSARPRHIPAEVKRAVWIRDGGKCVWPLASGGVCGSTRQLELDHIVPVARGGPSTIENLRLTCRCHNALAAVPSFGDAWMERFRSPRTGGEVPGPR